MKQKTKVIHYDNKGNIIDEKEIEIEIPDESVEQLTINEEVSAMGLSKKVKPYSSTVKYVKDDYVFYNGKTYKVIVDIVKGVNPPDELYYSETNIIDELSASEEAESEE